MHRLKQLFIKRLVWFVVAGFFILFICKGLFVKIIITSFVHPGGGFITVRKAYLGWNRLVLEDIHLFNPFKEKVADIDTVNIKWKNFFYRKPVFVKLHNPKVVLSPKTEDNWNVSFLLKYRDPFSFPEQLNVTIENGEFVLEDKKWKGSEKTPFIEHIQDVNGKVIANSSSRADIYLTGNLSQGGVVAIKGPLFAQPISGNIVIKGNKIPLSAWGNYFLAQDKQFKILDGDAELDLVAVISADKTKPSNISLDFTGTIKAEGGVLKVPLIRVPFDNISGTMLIARDTLRFKDMTGDIGFASAKFHGLFYQNFSQADLHLSLSDLTMEEMKFFAPFAEFSKSRIAGNGEGELDIAGTLPNPCYSGNFAFSSIQFPDKTEGSGKLKFSFINDKLIVHDFQLASISAQIAGKGVVSFEKNKPDNIAIQTAISGDLEKIIGISRLVKIPIKLPVNLPGNIALHGTVFGDISNPVGEFKLKWADNIKRDLSADISVVLGDNNLFVKGAISPHNSFPILISGYANYKPDIKYQLALHGEKINISFLTKIGLNGAKFDSGTFWGGVLGNKSEALFAGNLHNRFGDGIKFLGGMSHIGKSSLTRVKDTLFLFARSNGWPVSFVFKGKGNDKVISLYSKFNGVGYFDSHSQIGSWSLDGGNISFPGNNFIPLEKANISTIGHLSRNNIIGTVFSKHSVFAVIGNEKEQAVLAANLPFNVITSFMPAFKNKFKKRLNGKISLAGRFLRALRYPGYDGSVIIKEMKVGKSLFDLDGDFVLSGNQVEINRALLIDNHGAAILSGTIPFNMRLPVFLFAKFDRFSIFPELFLLGKQLPVKHTTFLQGRLSGNISVNGTMSNPVITGNNKIYHVSLMGQPFEEIETQYKYGNNGINLSKFIARYRNSIIHGKGSYDVKNGISVSGVSPYLELADIAVLNRNLYPTLGQGTASWSLKGSVSSPKGELDVEFDNIILNGIPIANAHGKLFLTQEGFEMKSLILRDKKGVVNISGKVFASFKKENRFNFIDAINIEGEIDGILLDTLIQWSRKKIPVTATGSIKGRFLLNGPVAKPTGSMQVFLDNGSVQGIPIETAHLDAVIFGEQLLIQKLFLSSNATRINGSGAFFKQGPKEATIDIQNLNMSMLSKFMPKFKDLNGDADLHLELSKEEKSLNGLAALEVRDGVIGKYSIDRLRALVSVQKGKAVIQDLRISKEGHKVQVTGTVPFEFLNYHIIPKDDVALKVSVERESLSFLPLIFPQISSSNGFVAADVNVTGKITSPVLEGKAVLEQGDIVFKTMKTPLSNLSLEVYFKPDGLHLINGKANLGGGEVSLSGNGTLNRFRIDNLNADLLVKKAKIESPHISGIVNAKLNLMDNNNEPELAGEIKFEQSTFGFPGSLPAHFAKIPLRLNISLVAGDRVSLRHPFVSLRINPGQLRLLGSLSYPYLNGELTTRHGNIYFLSNNFRITRGRAVFTEERGLVPYLETEATSTRRLESADISLNITGMPQQLNVELYSRPELPTKDIISILTGERGLQRLTQGGDLDRYLGIEAMNLLTQAVRSQVLYGVEEAFASTFSLDLFALEFLPSGHFGLKLGKEFTRNIYVTYSRSFTSGHQSVIRDPQSLWGIEYIFNPYSSLWLTVDNAGEYNTGVRTRWKF